MKWFEHVIKQFCKGKRDWNQKCFLDSRFCSFVKSIFSVTAWKLVTANHKWRKCFRLLLHTYHFGEQDQTRFSITVLITSSELILEDRLHWRTGSRMYFKSNGRVLSKNDSKLEVFFIKLRSQFKRESSVFTELISITVMTFYFQNRQRVLSPYTLNWIHNIMHTENFIIWDTENIK